MIFKRLFVMLLSVVLFSIPVLSQNKVVSGRVTDSKDGSALPNATVKVTGTDITTLTDMAGIFTMKVPSSATSLTISYVGYATQDVNIGEGNIMVSLVAMVTSLNDVVVIGYGTAKKKDLTGSVVAISAKDFNQGPITTPEQLISGKAAGVSITPNDGSPGSGSVIRIRGGSSLNASNDPLIVIDGMPLSNSGIAGVSNALAMINPNDIASFSILKDASATAIYGSRASNGVIMITTKKGQQGKPKFSFTTQLSAASLIKQFSVLDPQQFRNLVDTYGTPAQQALMGSANTNWQNQIYQTALTTDNNLSISGAIKKIPYRLSLGYLDQNGILKTSDLQRGTVGLNLNPNLLDNHLKIDLSVRASITRSRFANTDAIWGANQFDPTQSVYSGSPRYGGYWERLDPTNTITGLASLSPKNPLGELMQTLAVGHADRIIANAGIDYKVHFLPDLHAIANVGYDYAKGYGTTIVDDSAAQSYMSYQDPATGLYHGGVKSQYRSDNNNSYVNFYLNYTKQIDSKNRIEVMAGTEYQNYLTTNYNYKSYTYDSTLTYTPQYPFDKPQNRILSYLGRVNYSYNNILFLTASIRRDGSSKFAPAYRWGNFPSGALAWKLDQTFFKNSNVLSDLKFRLGYGVTGQQDGIGDYDYVSYYGLSDFKAEYQFGNTFYQMYRPGGYYANRKWEQTATTNVAIDYGFFNNRISGTIEYYYKNTTDLLNQITQPAFTNFSNTIVANIGSMENRGVEFTINVQPIHTKDITWDISFNATYNQNKITKLTFGDNTGFVFPIAGIGGNGGIQANAVGYPRASFRVFKQIYDQSTGKPIEDLFVDQNNDGQLNSNDLYIFKSPDPKMFYGFSTNFAYKKWSLGLTMRANVGNYNYNQVATNGAISKFLFSSYLANQSSDVLNTNFQGYGDFYQSNYYVQNASFLKMDNINIGYNMGKLRHSDVGIRFNASVQNVFIVTGYKGLDPEISGGIDNNGYPRPRTYLLGVGLDF